ncbi:MAG TPA: hypothetical protein VKB56_10100, partial [Terriglobales bacterium]|nr:hypothetical protein [Terriglobales bacterium]
TLDISRSGVRLVLPKMVAKDEIVTIGYKQRKSTFQVKWVTPQTNGTGTVAGLAATDPSVILWSEIRKEEKENYRDEFNREEERQRQVVMSASPALKPAKTEIAALAAQAINSAPSAASAVVAPVVDVAAASPPPKPLTTAQQVVAFTQNLIALEAELESNPVDLSSLQEFRAALTKTREAAWVAEQRIELEQAKENGGTQLPLTSVVNNERLRTAAQLCSELMEDFAKADLALDQRAVSTFLAVAEQLVFELALAAF